jgi:hypothetical protein
MIRSLLRIRSSYTQNRYHKFKVTRLPGEEVVVMMHDEATVGDLYAQIEYNFKQEQTALVAGPIFSTQVGAMLITKEMREASESVKDSPFVSMLLANDLFVYETNQDKAHILYGIECLELNLTNNRNVGIRQGRSPKRYRTASSSWPRSGKPLELSARPSKCPHGRTQRTPSFRRKGRSWRRCWARRIRTWR